MTTDESIPAKDPLFQLQSPDGRLAVVYRWRNDRFVHQILVNDAIVSNSVDGDASQAWPPSPPIQQISLESIDGVPTILGVGGAGRGHWSISVNWVSSGTTSSDESTGQFRFDIACRSKDRPEFLGSTYDGITESQTDLVLRTIVGNRRSEGQQATVSPQEQGNDQGREPYRWVYAIGTLEEEA